MNEAKTTDQAEQTAAAVPPSAGPVVSVELVEAIRDIHRLRLENMLLTGMVMGLALALWMSRERTPF